MPCQNIWGLHTPVSPSWDAASLRNKYTNTPFGSEGKQGLHGEEPTPAVQPLEPQACPTVLPFLPPHCLRGPAEGPQPPCGAEEGLACCPCAIWPWLAPCPPCPPWPRVSGQDWPYMAEVRPTAPMSPDVPGPVKSH